MILSSADILRILGGSEIIRLSAKVSIVDSKPVLSGAEGLFIYINRFPSTDEFQATWTIWIESDGSEPDDLVISEIKTLLPSVKISVGLMTVVTTTDFLSDSTQRAPEAPKAKVAQVDLTQYEERFQSLVEDVQDQMLLVHSGRAGRDGKDGLPGIPGRDGRDIDATETSLFELADVERGIPLQRGQVLMWSGTEWTNLYVPQTMPLVRVGDGGGSGGGGGGDCDGVIISDTAPETRDDGSELQEGDQWWDSTTGIMYVWYVDADGGQWVQSSGGGGEGGLSTLAGLLDTDTSGVVDGEILVYRSATGNWTAEPMPGGGGGVSSVAGKTGDVILVKEDISDFNEADYATTAQGALADTALQPGDNVSGLTNDAGYITAAEAPVQPEDVFSGDYNDLTNTPSIPSTPGDIGAATAAQGALADSAVQPGDNISDLTNDAGYITLAEVPGSGIPEAPQDGNYYVRQNGAWVDLATAIANLPIDGGVIT